METQLHSDEIARCGEPPLWSLSRTEVRVGLAVFVLSLIARCYALLPGYSVDDYVLIQDEGGGSYPMAVAQGRLLFFAVREVLAALGAAPPLSGPVYELLLALVLIAMGLAVCRLWGIREHTGACAIAVSFIALHPYQAEIFTFRTAPLLLALPLALAFGGLLACWRSRLAWLLSLLAVTCSLALYQAVLNYVAMALLFSIVFHLARVEDEDLYPDFWRTLRSRVMLVVLGVVIYAAFTVTVWTITGIRFGGRDALISSQEIVPRLAAVAKQWKVMFFGAEPILPLASKLLLLLTLAAGMLAYGLSLRRGSPRAAIARRTAAFGLAVAGGIPLCIGLVLVLTDWWPVPRVLAQTGMFWGGLLALMYRFARPAGRRILLTGYVVIMISFIGINNHIFYDQLRVNMRDMAKANRVLGRLEAQPGFDHAKGLTVNGASWGYPLPIRTAQGDMNISALYVSWAKVRLFDELSGQAFSAAPPEVEKKADEYCRNARRWPDQQSITMIDNYGVACLAPQ
jgi:hypothetical protein